MGYSSGRIRRERLSCHVERLIISKGRQRAWNWVGDPEVDHILIGTWVMTEVVLLQIRGKRRDQWIMLAEQWENKQNITSDLSVRFYSDIFNLKFKILLFF